MVVHFHSNVDIAELAGLLPYQRIFAPAKTAGGMQSPPHLVAVESNQEYAQVVAVLEGLNAEHPGKIIILPHHRNGKQLDADTAATLKKHLPNLKSNPTMSEVLKEQYAHTGGELWNPDNFL